jgi:Ca-activated chloride channel family protein
MSFSNYTILFLAAILPMALVAWVWRRESRRVALPFDHARPGAGKVWRAVINVAESTPALVLAVVLLILAGPQRLGEPKTKRVLTNIEFCVDISGSMTAPFGDGSRYDGSMKAIDEFLTYREGDAFGLTFFGNNVLHWVPLTTDTSAVRCAPPFMRPEKVPPWFGGTAIAKALIACKEVMEQREEGDRMIVLVTDGVSFDLYGDNDVAVANKLKEANIIVYAIHVADGEPPGPIVTITSMTGGEVFAAGDPDSLKTVFQRIDEMQKTRMEKTSAETLDHFVPFCVAGLALVAAGLLSSLGLRYTPW